MANVSGSLIITTRESLHFADLSGDYNPLHIDSDYARRLQFGRTVIHGVHHLLRLLDSIVGLLDQQLPALTAMSHMRVRFPNPVWENTTIEFNADYDNTTQTLRITAQCERNVIIDARIRFVEQPLIQTENAPEDRLFSRCVPKVPAFPPPPDGETLPLALHRSTANTLLPNLTQQLSPTTLAALLACTRVVGMRCPGLHSVFSGLNIEFHHGDHQPKPCLHFTVKRADKRVRLVNLEIQAPGISGTLDTFYRPEPVIQPDYVRVKSLVNGQTYAGKRALIVGGSRGIGEVTAKLLAAAGARVVITYHRGADEAENVAAEIRQGGGECQAMALNVTEALNVLPTALTHVYYFASPHIDANRSDQWDDKLFTKMSRYYVKAFADLVNGIQSASASDQVIRYFYPSSAYLDAPERGFAEYAAAKGAGEALCGQLQARYPNARFDCQRLPRVATDQTASIIPIKCDSALDVMQKVLFEVSEHPDHN